MHAFGGLGEAEATLALLAAHGLVEELPRQPGQKERRWRHLLGSGAVPAVPAREVETIGVAVDEDAGEAADEMAAPPSPLPAAPRPRVPPLAAAPNPAEADLRARVAALERRVDELAALVALLNGSPDVR
jgi:uncharacterized protein YceH (UPF0502 family)